MTGVQHTPGSWATEIDPIDDRDYATLIVTNDSSGPGNADGQLAAIAPALERLGYRVAAGIFSSSETGNTMRRERLFIMAERIGRLGHRRTPEPPE